MESSAIPQDKIARYLRELTTSLRALPSEQIHDIVEELRSHIVERLGPDSSPQHVAQILADLGNPVDLASLYLADDLRVRAVVSRSPLLIFRSLFRWATLSIAGFAALIFSLCGYFLSFAILCCAMFKTIHPQTAGLWQVSDPVNPYSFSLRLGFGVAPAGGTEVLGWWIVPLGLVAGFALFFLTAQLGLLCIRNFRHAVPASAR
jgi:uncharacterized membrane protein